MEIRKAAFLLFMPFILRILLATVGHGYLWVALVNRIHAIAIPRRAINILTCLAFLAAGTIPLTVAWLFYRAAVGGTGLLFGIALPRPAATYVEACSIAGVWAVAQWGWRRFSTPARPGERYRQSRVVRMARSPGRESPGRCDACLVARLPGNETLRLEELDRGVELARLPQALAGLSILHVSDFHFTGRVGKWYFEEVVRRCNERHADLVALTGDFVDEDSCTDWIPDTLAKLTAPCGVYFILGNHDLRVDSQHVRRTLVECGLVDLGGRFREVEIRGRRVVLAGNEVPWFQPAADFSNAPPSSLRGGLVRIVLAHSPDQLAWARRNEVDLVLAGHTHGGQICLPLIGPIFTPCLHGVRHTRGTFLVPPTVMHVTKGVSAQLPLRFGARPEAVLLTLHAPGSDVAQASRLCRTQDFRAGEDACSTSPILETTWKPRGSSGRNPSPAS